ncbi:MAG TPA: hypothetical protein VM348_12325 [Brevundimonas sp.]|jgi:hypothetical protein|nr:hypothetical protein [Brevundimonas sp.]
MTDPNVTTGPTTGATNVYVHVAPQDSALAIASLILGIFAICTVWILFIGLIAWILAPLGLILGLVAMRRPAGPGRGVAIAGVVCSSIGLLGCIAWVVLIGAVATVGASA